MIYNKSGLPIYSRCWGAFCHGIHKKNTLLSGFLSVISNLPKIIGQEDELKSIDFLKSKFFFKSVKSDIIIMLGIDVNSYSQNNEIGIFKVLNILSEFILHEVKIDQLDGLNSPENIKLVHNIENNILTEMISFEFSENDLHHDEHCPLCLNKLRKEQERNKNNQVWDLLGRMMRQK